MIEQPGNHIHQLFTMIKVGAAVIISRATYPHLWRHLANKLRTGF